MRLLAPALVICLLVFGSGPSPVARSAKVEQIPVVREAGVIAGVVVDPTNSVLPGVTVELRAGERVERTTVSDTAGAFRFEKVPPGTYDIRASLTGFTTATTRLTVAANRPVAPLRLTLAVAAMAETVTVQSASPQIDVSRSQVSGSRDAKSAGGRAGYLGSPPPASPPPGFNPGFNTEAYDRIEDNRFRRVTDDPLSTFSIDVDTASYSNVRRFLNGGTLPPPDAVRVEELINYFRFAYKDPQDDAPFSVTTEVSACPWNPRHRLALVGLQARRLTQDRTPPRNLVFLLDVSGSMTSADKLPLVKTAMRMLVDTLMPHDRVAIVVYAGASGLVLPSTPGSRKAEIQQAIAELRPGGSTNGAAGIQLAYDVANQSFMKDGINRVILATDGDFNVGVTSQGELIRLIEEKRERGIFLSVLGVGTGNLKDSTMEKLADKGNGNYAYLDSLHEARRVLIAEAGATLVTVAKDVKIQIEFNPRTVGAYRLIGYENRILQHQDFNDDKKDAGEIGAGHTVTALYEIIPPGEPLNGPSVDPLKYQDRPKTNASAHSGELMTVKLRYKQPDGSTSRLITRTASDRVGELTPNLGFAAAVAQFGMLLRGSEFKGASTWAGAQELARRHRGEDADGYRAEFVRLVDLAAALDAQQLTSPQSRR
jgi:Ca-activated chloride channel homolog